jgi:hypothetical protein
MTRLALAAHNQERATYRATFDRYGVKTWHGKSATTVLLLNITDADGNAVCDHLWMNLTRGFETLDLRPGDTVEFDGRVTAYTKGRYHNRTDYKLSRPTRIRKLAP